MALTIEKVMQGETARNMLVDCDIRLGPHMGDEVYHHEWARVDEPGGLDTD